MKTRIALLLALIGLLLVSGVAVAQSTGHGVPAWTGVPSPDTAEGYQLDGPTWQVRGAASGGGYSLQSGASPALTGSGCCCMYTPLLVR